MPVLRLSACRPGEQGAQQAAYRIYGETTPAMLEDDARKAKGLDDVFRQNADQPFFDQTAFDPDGKTGAHFHEMPNSDLGDRDDPVVVFCHGFQFDVRGNRPDPLNRVTTNNPHLLIYHFDEAASQDQEDSVHNTPWLARTFFDDGKGTEADMKGLALCWGYDGTGDTNGILDFSTPSGTWENFYSLAYEDAMISGHGLAAAISQLARRLEAAGQADRPINIVCHSLGTRTTMKALEILAERFRALGDPAIERVHNVILLAGACLFYQAGQAMERIVKANPDRVPSFFNVHSRDDEVVRVLGSRAALRTGRREVGLSIDLFSVLFNFTMGAPTLGIEGKPGTDYTGGIDYKPWVDINLDSQRVRDWGAQQGLDLKGDLGHGEADHWVHFTHAGNWELYRRILRGAPGFGIDDLRTAIPS